MNDKTKFLGRYLVADPKICHGQPTFRGTRILVADVLDMVAMGMAWESIAEQWRGKVTQAAIAEAVNLARDAFLDHIDEYRIDPNNPVDETAAEPAVA